LKDKSIVSKPHVTTFHALGYSILREQSGRVGEDVVSSFSILDPEDRKRIIQRVCGIEKSRFSGTANALEEAKQQLKNPTDFEDENPELADIFKKYQDYLKEQNTYDLADLLYVPVKLFERQPGILDYYREKYHWVLIDEYQDINYAQYKLIRNLMPDADANLCAIGDPDQAIYGFRGADVRFIRRFRGDYPGAAIYHLKQSYRCSDSILKASGNVMQRGGADDALLTGMEEGVKIKIVKNSTHKSEAEFVARTIEQMMGGLRFFSMDSSITEGHKEGEIDSLSDFVVLCRVKGQMEALEKAFMDHSIPYQVVGEEPFFKQEPVCSIIDLLKFSRNPKNTILKDKLIEKEIVTPLELGALKEIVDNAKSVKEMIVNLLNNLFNDLKTASHDAASLNESNQKLLRGVQGGGFLEKSPPGFKRLLDFVGDFGDDLEGFLRFTALGTAVDTYRPDLEHVTLMTMHGAKGLEFKAVFIVGCEEGLLPYSLFKSQSSDPEEERRLLYVGMTRAKKFLFLSHAEKRFLLGREYKLGRSLFLNRIERELIELSQQEKKAKEPIQRTLFDLK